MDKKQLLLLVLAVVGFSFYFNGVKAGTEGFNCPDNPTYFYENFFFPTAIIPCDYDCKTNHASTKGTCASNFNCVCSNDTAYVAPANPPSLVKPLDGNCTYFNPAINVTGVCQCAINNPLVAEDYKFICKNDCQCNHGAANGTCDFNAKQCYCSYPTGFVWTNGSDGRNATCQFQGGYNSSQEIRNLLDPIRSLLTTLGLGG